MPVPKFAYSDRYDGRVFVRTIDDNGHWHKKTIGHMTVSTPGEQRMVPNLYFKEKYRDIYLEAYPDQQIPFHEISIGMYALTLAIANKIGLYEDLQNNYGPIFANSILDYAMYSILYHSNTTQLFEQNMKKEVLFNDKLYSDQWYSSFFSNKLNEDNHHQFKIKWLQRLKQNGLKKVWLAIDGSNNDCEARSSFLAKYGFPKSHNKSKTVVGYMYVVDAETGALVTYFIYEGNVPDSQAFQTVATFLSNTQIEIEGVILDRGFAVEKVFETIDENKWKYVVMLPQNTYGHKQMVNDYINTIPWKSEYILKDEELFGINETKQLFKDHKRESNICLYYDGAKGSLKSIKLIKEIQAELKRINKNIEKGKKTTIKKELRKYISIENNDSDPNIVINHENWNNKMSTNGFFSLATSKDINPTEGNKLYKMRNTAEIQYSILKSQEGGSIIRTHKSEGIYSKFAVMFVASIIRHEIEKTCKDLELDTNVMIQNLEHVTLIYTAENKYEAVRNLSTDLKKLFKVFDLEEDDLEKLARSFNDRNRTDSKNPYRVLPNKDQPIIRKNSHKKGKPIVNTSTDITDNSLENNKSKGGRPKGKKDSAPRQSRSDKGKPRSHYNKRPV